MSIKGGKKHTDF